MKMNLKAGVLLGGLASMFTLVSPATSFAATSTTQKVSIQVSGATSVPQPEPTNGILVGGACAPDVSQFDLSQTMVTNPQTKKPEPNHVVFAVQVAPGANSSKALTEADIAKYTTVYVQIYDAAGDYIRLYNLPKNAAPDPNTKNPFFVQCVWLTNAQVATKFGETMLPAGKYTYKFLVSVDDPKTGLIQQTWAPKDNTFTLVDSSTSKSTTTTTSGTSSTSTAGTTTTSTSATSTTSSTTTSASSSASTSSTTASK